MNTGDWVESCTAVVENHDGTFEIVVWQTHGSEVETVEANEPEALVAA